MEYEKDLYDKSCTALTNESRQLKQQLEEVKSNLEKEREYQDAQLLDKMQQKPAKELRMATQGVEDARKEAQYHADTCKSKIAENNKHKDEKNRLNHQLHELEREEDLLEKEEDELNKHHHSLKPEHDESSQKYKDVEGENRIHINDLEKSLTETRGLFSENSDLKARVEYLYNMLEQTDRLKNIDVNELRMIITSNTQVNDTISTLVGKWDSISKFQKTDEPLESSFK